MARSLRHRPCWPSLCNPPLSQGHCLGSAAAITRQLGISKSHSFTCALFGLKPSGTHFDQSSRGIQHCSLETPSLLPASELFMTMSLKHSRHMIYPQGERPGAYAFLQVFLLPMVMGRKICLIITSVLYFNIPMQSSPGTGLLSYAWLFCLPI